MDCCENKNITYKTYENVCINCGVIHDYKYVNEVSFRDYNIIMSNILFYKKRFIKGKNIYISYVFILKKLMTTQNYFLIIHWKILQNYLICKEYLY